MSELARSALAITIHQLARRAGSTVVATSMMSFRTFDAGEPVMSRGAETTGDYLDPPRRSSRINRSVRSARAEPNLRCWLRSPLSDPGIPEPGSLASSASRNVVVWFWAATPAATFLADAGAGCRVQGGIDPQPVNRGVTGVGPCGVTAVTVPLASSQKYAVVVTTRPSGSTLSRVTL